MGAVPFCPMNVHCIVPFKSHDTSFQACVNDCCPMGYVSISIEEQHKGEVKLELDMTIEDAEELIDALRIIIARRKP